MKRRDMTTRWRLAWWRLAMSLFALAALPVAATAQDTGATRVTAPMAAAIARARGIANAGEMTAARDVLDSLVANAEPSSIDLAEALYWRAVLSDRAGDAERDWKRLVVETPIAPQVPDALLKLADIEILRGRPPVARGYLERLLRDFDDVPQRPKALMLIARSYFEERDAVRACAAVDTLRARGVPDGELNLQVNELRRRCTLATPAPATPVVTPVVTPAQTSADDTPEKSAGESRGKGRNTEARYAVQIAAYESRAQADALVKRLSKRGWKARIDGERKPYRVRVGSFATRAEATEMLARLRKQGQRGFVAELGK